MTINSFLHPLGELHFDRYKPEDVQEALDVTERLGNERIKALVALKSTERTFENTVIALAEAFEEMDMVASVASHMHSVLAETWQEANSLASERWSQAMNELSFDTGVYEALIATREHKVVADGLNTAERKLLDDMILEYERDGIALAEEKQAELKDIRNALSKASVRFNENTVAAIDKAGLHVASASQLAGLSDEFIESCREAAAERKEDGYWLAYSAPTYPYIMATCDVAETREHMYEVAVNLAGDTNAEVARDILLLRRRRANLLGYKDHSDYALQRRMAKNGQTAYDFIVGLTNTYRDATKKEYEGLQTYIREITSDKSYELSLADIESGLDFYYSAKQRAAGIGIDGEMLKDYFTLDAVVKEMFASLETLYGITIVETKESVWLPDVAVYNIFDGDKHLSTVWCDWYARKGKNPGAWANILYDADRANGSYAKPHLGVVTTSFEAPGKAGQARMTLRDVETLWHEFGHLIHLTFSATQLREQSAFSSAWDFVEAPSQIMENWVWQPETMKRMSRHVETGEALSDEIISKLLAGRTFHVGMRAMRQLYFATVDLKLHREFDPGGEVSVAEYARKVKADFLPIPPNPRDATIASFNHIFAGGYASAYYSYKWAEVIEADLFSRFATEGYMNPAVGRAYRETILARGSEEEPEVLVQNFLGRPSNPQALYKRDGIL